jgi:hypothetical protein
MLKRPDAKELLAYLLRSHYLVKKPPLSSSAPREQFQKRRPEPRRHNRVETEKEIPETPHEPIVSSEPSANDYTAPVEQEIEAKPHVPAEPSPFARLYVTLGREDGFRDLTQLMNYISQISKVDIGNFTGAGHVRDQSSHVEVDREVSEQIIQAVNGRARDGFPKDEKDTRTPTILCELATGIAPPKRDSTRGPRRENRFPPRHRRDRR